MSRTYLCLLAHVSLLGLIVLVAAGCGSAKPQTSAPLSSDERDSLIRRGKSAQVFGVTTYSTDQGPVFAGAFRQHQGHAARVNFLSDKSTTTPVIGVNENKWLMMLDTTAAESWITVEALQGLKGVVLVQPDPIEKTARHVNDTTGGLAAVVPKLTIDKLHVERAVMFMRNAHGPLGSLTRWEKSPYLDGIIGSDFLRSFQFVRISLKGRYVAFSATTPYPNSANAIATLPLKELQGGMAVEGLIDGETQLILIDIAGDFEVALERPESRTLKQISIGDIVFRQVDVDTTADLGLGLKAPPRIGRQLLERYDLIINNRGSELLLERPAL